MRALDWDLTKYRVDGSRQVDLDGWVPSDTQGLDEESATKQFKKNRKRIIDYQERLYAEHQHSVLFVLQAMDTAGKDSSIRKLTRGINPQGCRVASFKGPSQRELAQDFLWRIHGQTPPKGHITIFNRSHYEDVLITRVHGWVSDEVIATRYQQINDFEQMLVENGTAVVKVMLNISKDYQAERLRKRLCPEKYWKFNPQDLEERKKWDDYMQAYQRVLNHCAAEQHPWYVVPAENRWFRDLVLSQILLNSLKAIDPQYPEPDFNPADYPPESID